jgi:hypothetical protein
VRTTSFGKDKVRITESITVEGLDVDSALLHLAERLTQSAIEIREKLTRKLNGRF